MKWLGYLGYGPRGSQQTAVSTDYVVVFNGTTFLQYHVFLSVGILCLFLQLFSVLPGIQKLL